MVTDGPGPYPTSIVISERVVRKDRDTAPTYYGATNMLGLLVEGGRPGGMLQKPIFYVVEALFIAGSARGEFRFSLTHEGPTDERREIASMTQSLLRTDEHVLISANWRILAPVPGFHWFDSWINDVRVMRVPFLIRVIG